MRKVVSEYSYKAKDYWFCLYKFAHKMHMFTKTLPL